jgi:hypothetical protein
LLIVVVVVQAKSRIFSGKSIPFGFFF